MKKGFFPLIILIMIGSCTFSQNTIPAFHLANVKSSGANRTNAANFNKTRIDDNCIPYTEIGECPNDDTLYTYPVDVTPYDSGYIEGSNAYLSNAQAVYYPFTSFCHDSLTAVCFKMAVANHTSSNDKITLTVWGNDGINGSPGTVLTTQDVRIRDIIPDSLTCVDLRKPVLNTGHVYVGFQVYYSNNTFNKNKAVACYQTKFWYPGDYNTCDSIYNTAWCDFPDSNGVHKWFSYDQAFGSGAVLYINPTLCSDYCDCLVTITPSSASICKKKSVTLTATGGDVYTWAPSTGLNVTTGSTVSASPKTTTTYTVTGNGGGCFPVTVTVTVKTAPTVTVSSAPCINHSIILTATAKPSTGEYYQWKMGGSKILGATNSTYSATISGSYKCVVTYISTGCDITSKAISVTICKLDNLGEKPFNVSVYPNPFTRSLWLEITGAEKNVTISLFDISGRVVKIYDNADPSSPIEIDEGILNGVYFVKVNSGTNWKLMKVVKE